MTTDPLRLDDIDRKILAALHDDGRETYEQLGRRVSLSAPAAKRRVDRLRDAGVIRGFTVVVDHSAVATTIEAVIELFYAPGVQLDRVRDSLRPHPEVVEAWSVTGDADCMVRVRVRDPLDLERLLMELQREAAVMRTSSQFVLSHLIERRD